jgi:tetratricopeptide (TPR) repeat protein
MKKLLFLLFFFPLVIFGQNESTVNKNLVYGLGFAKINDFEKAIFYYSKAIKLYPNDYRAYFERGNSKRSLDNYSDAILDYTKAIKLNSNNITIYYSRGVLKYITEDYSGAISDLSYVIDNNTSSSAEAYFFRGMSRIYSKLYFPANLDLDKAIELNPDFALAYRERGVLSSGFGDLNNACKDWKKAASLGDKDSEKLVAEKCN